jgi:hypothetical protein
LMDSTADSFDLGLTKEEKERKKEYKLKIK